MFEDPPKFKDYEVLGELGKGAQGKVYKVRWQNRKSEVFGALKFLNSQEFKTILKEVSSWARVSQHPNILTFLGADEEDGRFFTISELATEGDLEKWIEEKGGKEEFFDEAIGIMLGVLQGLEHLHQNDIVHRDIKPANIFLKGKTPLLADFGLARGLDLKQSSILGGTLAFMSPELINVYLSLKAKSKLNYERTELDDLWAIAATFQNMLTGEIPFENIDAIRMCQPNPISTNVSPKVKDFLKKAFAKNGAERFQTAQAMIDDLTKANEISDKETIIDEDFGGSENFGVEPTRVWRVIEAEKQGQAEEQTRSEKERPQQGETGEDRFIKETDWQLIEALMREKRKELQNFTNSIGMEFVLIPLGSFMMGSEYGTDYERPVHKVTISKDFWMQITQVTQAQYERAMGTNPSYFKNCLRCPVERVSWEDAQNFIKKLNAKGDGIYRLPTEAEWEYACRAGTTGDYSGILDAMAFYNANSGSKTQEVGRKQANPWGLYDIHGNVWEWVADWYEAYSSGNVTDPAGAASGSNRVIRGGGWGNNANNLRSAYRRYVTPSYRGSDLGFRLVWEN